MLFWKKLPSRKPESQKREALTYYHGGVDSLSVGEIIIPRNKNLQWSGTKLTWQGVPAEELGDHGDTVSITTDREVAKGYAGEYMSPRGARVPGRVYEVKPLGEAVVDPDWLWSFPAIARCTEGSEIVAVLDQMPVENNPSVLVKALVKYYAYAATGAPVYDDQGYVIFTPELAQLGKTEQSLKALGKWPQKHQYLYYEPQRTPGH
ncbi:hypothetical protein [Arthrobacter flavus]|uniref:Uncharacterized protein n=1 Tax=Arthrobacter flavus TaxID=95172 RepID=A0ABW4Q7V8_9MICC